MNIAERMFLRMHKIHFWILCHGKSTKDLGYFFIYINKIKYVYNEQRKKILDDLLTSLNGEHYWAKIF